jgi:hypothetical protein
MIQILAAGTGMSKKRGPGRRRKIGRPKKAPGEPTDHRLTPKMRVAILAIVKDNKSRAEAAKVAGLTEDAVREALMHCAKAKAAHALIKELDGPNAAARVAAARMFLEENDRSPAGNGPPRVPGFAI